MPLLHYEQHSKERSQPPRSLMENQCVKIRPEGGHPMPSNKPIKKVKQPLYLKIASKMESIQNKD